MTQDYLRQQFKLALQDYKLATTEDKRQQALRDMARTVATATAVYGFAFADELQEGGKEHEH